jgi:SNF2 family DNA or RNA helicase
VVVTNYENLQWLAEQTLDFDGVVFDELTRLKNPSGKRFKALSKVVDAMTIRWGLTGSFTSNGLEDVFGQCKIIDQKLLGRAKGAFLQQYFYCLNREYNDWQPRPGALEAVMERIRPATYLLEPGEYRDQLPPLHVVPVRCQLDDRAPYEKMKKDFVVDFPDAQAVAANAAAVTMKLQQMACGFVYNSTRTLADTPGAFHVEHYAMWFSRHKMQALADLLEENQRANTIIAYNFIEELAELRRWFPHAQTLDDDRAIERWNAGEIQLLLIHPKSAGHGLNLQSGGHHLVFTSLPWSLELYEQTIGRLHRSGQRHDVWVYLMLSQDTIDERILGALQDKRSLSDVAMEALK